MKHDKHNSENQGAKLRAHEDAPSPYWRRAHLDWRVWVVVALMIVLMFVYVMTDSLSINPGPRVGTPMPALAP